MAINHQRLDKFIANYYQINKRSVRLMLAQKKVKVDGDIATDVSTIVHQFSTISVDEQTIQQRSPTYLMLYKPVGVVSATKDSQHQTVLDLLQPQCSPLLIQQLHIVGRLDLNTSGLMLLTNDSRWSNKVTSPISKISKQYLVTLRDKITADYIEAFAQGMYFSYEGITTLPAKLEIKSDHQALVTLTEGRYHQIKRMFGRFRNPVVALHRISVGEILLDPKLAVGKSRYLTQHEVDSVGAFERSL